MFALYIFYFFFFQAEDGIRDADVTGVQTCALPILREIFNVKAHICRFGGDEFAVYLHDYEPEEVNELIKKLANILENHQVTAISNDYRLKFSYGSTKIELPFDFSKVYEISDKKLYEHKASKNNLRR